MKRVVVIGCPGAGKSVFTRKLQEKTGLPTIHLDYYYHQKGYNYYKDKPEWIDRVKQLLKQPTWIMDGNYSSSLRERVHVADTIIYLDFPRGMSLYRVLKRRMHYRNRKREEMPSGWVEQANFEFLKYVWGFNSTSRPIILDLLAKQSGKSIHIFTNSKQVNQYLKML